MSEAVIHGQQRGVLARFGTALRAVVPRPVVEPSDPPRAAASPVGQRQQNALAVLTATRAVIRRGWAQNTWYVMETPAGRRRSMQSIFPGRLDRTRVVEACLVGAVVHAAWQQSPRPEHAYPAVDALWHTLLGGSGTTGGDPVGPVCSPPVRVARVRDLTTWNDRPYRTKGDVLELLDRAVARVAEAGTRTASPR
jgi:hypothetical protein